MRIEVPAEVFYVIITGLLQKIPPQTSLGNSPIMPTGFPPKIPRKPVVPPVILPRTPPGFFFN